MNQSAYLETTAFVTEAYGVEILTNNELADNAGGLAFLIPVAIALLEGTAIGVTIAGGLYGVYKAARS
ncbi:hypothetical protein EXU85_28830 [Spirosoma sp. KCTC 42546]|uniref:hypothetical protein n=1 Tax=Spirosoma sp. KCTC 42546 TaxID=2520506 RepID=UPI0011597BD4|nr:hypothetical protein [Spirosoma sp. KCTC 42546]QDK82398.1 hypothetical protein EXU85_28830 [Spirosoma sp. KCTC 42546]